MSSYFLISENLWKFEQNGARDLIVNSSPNFFKAVYTTTCVWLDGKDTRVWLYTLPFLI